MKQTNYLHVIILALLGMVLAGCVPANLSGDAAKFILNENPAPNTIYLNLDSADLDADVGDTVTLFIRANQLSTGIYSIQFDLDYNPAYLEYVSFSEGTFLSEGGSSITNVIQPTLQSEGALRNAGVSRQGNVPGVAGSGTIGEVTFRVLQRGYSEVGFSNVIAPDANINPVNLNIVDGRVYIYACTDTDLDGYGESCDLGLDCNDNDFYINPGEAEQCDGLDNNCNGQVDEGCECVDGAQQACGTNVGVCEFGTQTCDGGEWGECAGGIETDPATEICNGLDDDCDGEVDEELVRSCADGNRGVCAEGTQTCTQGSWSACPSGESQEICGNNLDDDCDGSIDNACGTCTPGETRDCPVPSGASNVCDAGAQTCTANREWGACTGAVYAQEETCNGRDDDCDGQVDEDLFISCSDNGVGLCAQGTAECVNGDWQGCPSPQEEICGNSIDEDCNGQDQQCEGTQDLSWSLCLAKSFGDWNSDQCRRSNCPDNFILVGCQQNNQEQRREVCLQMSKTSCSENPSCETGIQVFTSSCDSSTPTVTRDEREESRDELRRARRNYYDKREEYRRSRTHEAEADYRDAKSSYLERVKSYRDLTARLRANQKAVFARRFVR